MGFKSVYGVNSILFTVVLPKRLYEAHIPNIYYHLGKKHIDCYLYGFTPCLAQSSLNYASLGWLPALSYPKYRAKFDFAAGGRKSPNF